ncbi:MAG: molybdate ABC transporter substrate-binding protein, partial [Mycetocola sp.]
MNARRRQTATAAGGLALALALTACAASSGTGRESATDGSDGEITVLAAASLTSTFTELADEFESAHPGASVTLSFAGSSDLVTQIVEGAPADLFASADETTMQVLVDREL